MTEEINQTEQEITTDENASVEIPAEPAAPSKGLNHIYYEIESDLLAKPNALADILITDVVPTIIFCNQPSEADLIEVILSKRQVSCQKLIGRVPGAKVAAAAAQAVAGEFAALIVTDISARDLDVGMFTKLVNYSTHEDPETYLHRSEVSAESTLETVVSMVCPLDHGHFHYLKKVLDFEINTEKLPGNEEIQKAQFTQLIASAEAFEYPEEMEKFEVLLKQVKESDKNDEMFKYLLFNVVNVMPELQVKANNPRGNRRGGGKHNAKGRVGGADLNEEEARILKRNIPKTEYMRFYVGVGQNQNYDQEKVAKLLNEAANLPTEQLSNFVDRGIYSFVDVLKANSAGLVEILDGYQLENGESLVFKKAASIVVNMDEDPLAKKAAPAKAEKAAEAKEEE